MHTVQSCITASDADNDFSICINLSVCGSDVDTAVGIHDLWRAALQRVLASPTEACGGLVRFSGEQGPARPG